MRPAPLLAAAFWMVREQAGYNFSEAAPPEHPNAIAFVATVNEAHFARESFS
jgi:hypothetical protein